MGTPTGRPRGFNAAQKGTGQTGFQPAPRTATTPPTPPAATPAPAVMPVVPHNTPGTLFPPVFLPMSLKNMDAAVLFAELHEFARTLPAHDRDRLMAAARDAARLHRNQRRGTRNNYQTTPYIEHPLRNTLRLTRWHVTNPDTLIAALLHDTIEDCTAVAAKTVATNHPGDTPTEQTINWMTDTYGPTVTETVLLVTNPPRKRNTSTSTNERNTEYLAHVTTALKHPHAFLVKAADLVDNAGSLPHQAHDADPTLTAARATKYTPAVNAALHALNTTDLTMFGPNVKPTVTTALTNVADTLKNLQTSN